MHTACVCIFLNNPLSWCSSDRKVPFCCSHVPCHISKNHTEQLKTTAAAFGGEPCGLLGLPCFAIPLHCAPWSHLGPTQRVMENSCLPQRLVSVGLCRDQDGHGAVLSPSSSSRLFYCLNCERGFPHLIPGQELQLLQGVSMKLSLSGSAGAGACVFLMFHRACWDANSPEDPHQHGASGRGRQSTFEKTSRDLSSAQPGNEKIIYPT